MMSSRILLVVGVLLLAIQLAHGHGYLKVPPSRNYIASLQATENCPQCYNSGGPSVVQGATPGGQYPMPTETVASAVRHTMCGDAPTVPVSERKYNPFPVPASMAEYKPGQVMDIAIQITAHHRGHFEFRVCDAAKLSDPTTVTFACANENLLKRVSVPGEVSPVDVNHPERYYLEPDCSPGYNTTIFMKYQIPSTLTCQHCILQWWWTSANSCNPPDYDKRSPMPSDSGCQWWQPGLSLCGTAYPEEFWNCADIRISGTASPTGTVPPPPPPPPPPAEPAPLPVAAPTEPAPLPVAAPTEPAPLPVAAPTEPPPPPVSVPTEPVTAPTEPAPHHRAPHHHAPDHHAPDHHAPDHRGPDYRAPDHRAPDYRAPDHPAPKGCAILGGQCGGKDWTGPRCCPSGSRCMAYLDTYSQCRQGSCPAGWLCQKDKSTQESEL